MQAGVGVASNTDTPTYQPEASRIDDSRFRLLFENSLDAIVVTDDSGRLLDVNPSARILFGSNPEPIRETPGGDAAADTLPDAAEQFVGHLLNERKSGEFAFVRTDGQTRFATYTTCRMAPGQHVSFLHDITDLHRLGAVAVNTDIAQGKQDALEREQLARTAEAEHARLKSILDQLPYGVTMAEMPGGKLL